MIDIWSFLVRVPDSKNGDGYAAAAATGAAGIVNIDDQFFLKKRLPKNL